MSEIKEGVDIGQTKNSDRKAFKKRAIHLAGSAMAGVGLALGADQEARPVSAADTPTPDAIGTQIAGAKATLTAETRRTQREKELNELNKQLTVIAEQRNATSTLRTSTTTPSSTPRPGTATPSPTAEPSATTRPSATRISSAEGTATAETIRLRALGERQAEIKATATADAELAATPAAASTATAEARQTAVARAEERSRNQGGIGPGEIAKGVVGSGLIAAALYFGRNRIRGGRNIFRGATNWVNEQAVKGIGWVNRRRGTGGAAPGAGTPPAGGTPPTPPVPPVGGLPPGTP